MDININLPDSLTYLGDKKKMQRIVTNILENSIKYTPEQGRVAVSAAIDMGSDLGWGDEIARTVIEHVDQQLMAHQVQQLNLDLSLCHLVLDDTDGALQRLETAVEDGLVDGWWHTMSHPLYAQLQFEPRYLHVRKRIEENMAEQRERFFEMSQQPGT